MNISKSVLDYIATKSSKSGDTFTGEIVGTTLKARHKRTIQSTTSTATFTHNCDSYDTGKISSQSADITFAAPSGTPYDLQEFLLYLKDDGTSRAITWNSAFSSVMETLPTSTTAGKQMVLGFAYNTATSKWELISLLIGV